jgi:hypothetical protein
MVDQEIIDVQGWKGQGTNEISTDGDNIILRCWKKRKTDGEHYFTEHKVKREAVDTLLMLIEKNCEVREEYKPQYLWRKIVEHYDLGKKEGMDNELVIGFFNGTRFRSRYYFALYYFPMLILSEWGKIYFGEKIWMRLG